jgi:hypothetical protein
MRRSFHVFLLAAGFVLAVGLCGCAGASQAHTTQPLHSLRLAGSVHGGQQPVSGSTIQLYAVGSAGDGSAAQPLIAGVVFTDMGGNFTITSDYTCPVSNPDADVYLVATGGNPGLQTPTDNLALAMMTALGPCSGLNASTVAQVNEETTVGSLAALYPYATSFAAIGASNSDALVNAFARVNEYVDVTAGAVPGPALPAGYYASSVEIATLSDIVATCVNSSGGVAGDSSACGYLFHLATPPSGIAPTDTVAAVIDILKNPTHNVADIYDLVPSIGAAFQPVLRSAPMDWTLPIESVPDTPSFSIEGGNYTGSQSVTLSDGTASTTIYYTIDGSVPTTASAVYGGAITVSSTETIRAIASDGRSMSAVASATYTITTPPPPPVTSVVPSPSPASGLPHSTLTFGRFVFVSVQGTGQIFTYDLSSGYLVQAVAPYKMSCQDPSGMVIANIAGDHVMAVVCFDSGALVTLRVNSDGSLSPLGIASGLDTPYFGIALDGTDVYVPLFGVSQSANGAVAKVSIATPTVPSITAMTTLASPIPDGYANPGYVAVANGSVFVAAGSESSLPGGSKDTSSTIQVVDEATMTLVGAPVVVAHSPQALTVSGNTLFATFYDAQQIESFDVSTPATVQVLQVFPNVGCTSIPMKISGTVAYVGCYAQNTMETVDVTHPAAMTVVKTTSNIVAPEDLTLSGRFVVVASGVGGGNVYSIDTTQ